MTDQEKINAELQLKTNLQDMRFSITMQELREQREDIRRLNGKLDSIVNQLHCNFVQTMIGVGAIMVAVGGLIIAVLK